MLTSRLTGIDCVGFDAPGAEILMAPVQVPAGKPVGLICTLSVLGVALLCGDTTSQLLPQELVLGIALKLMVPPPVLVRVKVCGAGAAAPI